MTPNEMFRYQRSAAMGDEVRETFPKWSASECIYCSRRFTAQNPCCCDDGIFDGEHVDGVCLECHIPRHGKRHKRAPGAERSE